MQEKQKDKLLVLCGPTAVGKTELALQIAERFTCEIISVDSMQVYRHMDIGTAKPTKAERSRIPHYLIDIVNPDEEYTLGHFVRDAEQAVQTIRSHGKNPLLVGGTGLYLKGFLNGVFTTNQVVAAKNSAVGNSDNNSVRHKNRRFESHFPNDQQRLFHGVQGFDIGQGIPGGTPADAKTAQGA